MVQIVWEEKHWCEIRKPINKSRRFTDFALAIKPLIIKVIIKLFKYLVKTHMGANSKCSFEPLLKIQQNHNSTLQQ